MPRCFIITLSLFASTQLFAEDLNYNRDIRPILSDKCFFCHGPDEEERQADLRLDVEDAAKEYAVVPGDLEGSEIIARIVSDDADLVMPPADSGKSLTKEEIEKVKAWVKQGAPYQPFWAYVPPTQHEIPKTNLSAFGDSPLTMSNWIDHFILSRLKEESLVPSSPADLRTLVRRLHFDLTGLPPTPDVVEEFVANPSNRAYEKLVDKLLASPAFGERMAVYWFDLVRYADTVGYHGDQDHAISPYRDWVIHALNENMPFDQFTVEQIAGDLLPNPTIDQKIATGYNRLLQTSHEGGVQPKEYLAIYAADRVRNLSAVWMGATMGCCQCHSHKYDPYSIKDFYAMEAFFADIDEEQHFSLGSNALPTKRPPEIEVLPRKDRAHYEDLLAKIDQLNKASKQAESEKEAPALKELLSEKEQLDKRKRKSMITVAKEPRVIRLLPRGNWLDDSGPIMSPEIPEFMGKLEVGERRASRMDLAKWLCDAENGVGGLTARVQVNRFWYLMFGTGIARDLDDFGGQGEPPVHPELLDNLAVEFVQSGWDIKHMFKLMVMSKTYRQSSAATDELLENDPYNQLFARQSSYRLPAEMIRDNALAISGLLVHGDTWETAHPYQPEGYYRHLNFPTRKYKSDQDANQWRRGVYVHWQRQFLHPMLKATDAPSREECTAQRPRSNTPLAALALLNDPTFVEAARTFAARILTEAEGSDAEKLQFAYELALARAPHENERKVLLDLLLQERERYTQDTKEAQRLEGVGLSKTAANMDAAELAAWTNVARVILNLNETISRL